MLTMNDADSMYIAEEQSGYAKQLVEDGVFGRQVDLLLLGFSYAVAKNITPPERIKRHDLLRAGGIEPDTRLAVESVAIWYARENGLEVPEDPKGLLDLICRIGSAGVEALKDEWKGRAKSQIELAVLRLANPGDASTTQ